MKQILFKIGNYYRCSVFKGGFVGAYYRPVMFYGAGILAMVGCKKYESVEKAVEQIVVCDGVTLPDKVGVEKYEEKKKTLNLYIPRLKI